MRAYSDLALDCMEAAGKDSIEGVSQVVEKIGEIEVHRISVSSDAAAERLSKEKGDYYTLEGLRLASAATDGEATARAIGEVIKVVLEKISPKSVIVFGLGNRQITPDALGPEAIEKLLVTRHITKELAESLSLPELFPVAAIALGVLGQTGIETAQTAKAICDSIAPSCAIVIDALAASDASRLATTVQIASAGLSPGSGVKNARAALNYDTLGIPVISIGIPLVADIAVLLDNPLKAQEGLIVTPKDIDVLIDHASQVIAGGINLALQTALSYEDILALT